MASFGSSTSLLTDHASFRRPQPPCSHQKSRRTGSSILTQPFPGLFNSGLVFRRRPVSRCSSAGILLYGANRPIEIGLLPSVLTGSCATIVDLFGGHAFSRQLPAIPHFRRVELRRTHLLAKHTTSRSRQESLRMPDVFRPGFQAEPHRRRQR